MPHIAKRENMTRRCSPQQENIVDLHAVGNANTTWQTADISTAIYSMSISTANLQIILLGILFLPNLLELGVTGAG